MYIYKVCGMRLTCAAEWPEYIVIREHVADNWQSENHMRFFDDEESARNCFNGGHYGE